MVHRLLPPLESKRESLTEIVFAAIRAAIVDKTLPPGERLSEAALAGALSVSKTPVREALLRLRQIGLVEAAPGGLRVIEPSVRRIRDAYELRSGLERMSAYLAAQRSRPPDHKTILEAARASLVAARDGDGAGFRTWDTEFHLAVSRAGGNLMVQLAVENALVLASALRDRDIPARGGSVLCGQAHVRVAEAVTHGDGEAAAIEMADHIQDVKTMVLDSLSSPKVCALGGGAVA